VFIRKGLIRGLLVPGRYGLSLITWVRSWVEGFLPMTSLKWETYQPVSHLSILQALERWVGPVYEVHMYSVNALSVRVVNLINLIYVDTWNWLL